MAEKTTQLSNHQLYEINPFSTTRNYSKIISNEQIEMRKNPDYYSGKFTVTKSTDNPKYKIADEVSNILSLQTDDGEVPSLSARYAIIEALTDAYIDQTGTRPHGAQIQRLANWCMLETLTDNRPDKVAKTEYPILTKKQLKTRYRREVTGDIQGSNEAFVEHIMNEREGLGYGEGNRKTKTHHVRND